MSKTKNSRYHIVSNLEEHMTRYFLSEKLQRFEKGEKYIWADLYEELGKYCGITPSTVSQMRLKGLSPSYIVGIKMSEFLGVSPTDIWSIVDENGVSDKTTVKCAQDDCERVAGTRGYCMKHVPSIYREMKK